MCQGSVHVAFADILGVHRDRRCDLPVAPKTSLKQLTQKLSGEPIRKPRVFHSDADEVDYVKEAAVVDVFERNFPICKSVVLSD